MLSISRFFAVCMVFLLSNAAYAQGLSNVNKFFTNLNTALHTVALVVIVTSILVCAFKIMFNGESLRDCKNWIIGGALVAGAAEIGQMLLS